MECPTSPAFGVRRGAAKTSVESRGRRSPESRRRHPRIRSRKTFARVREESIHGLGGGRRSPESERKASADSIAETLSHVTARHIVVTQPTHSIVAAPLTWARFRRAGA